MWVCHQKHVFDVLFEQQREILPLFLLIIIAISPRPANYMTFQVVHNIVVTIIKVHSIALVDYIVDSDHNHIIVDSCLDIRLHHTANYS